MKFIGLEYQDMSRLARMSATRRADFQARCADYDEELRECGYLISTNNLQGEHNTVAVRSSNGQVEVRKGPVAANSEQLARILILEAYDLNHAIALLSQHPIVWEGAFEIRPADSSTDSKTCASYSISHAVEGRL